MDVAPRSGFSRSANLLVSLKFTSDRPRLPWQRQFGNFNSKLARTPLNQEIELRILHQTGGFSRSSNLAVWLKFTSDCPCCHGNDILEILRQK